MKRIIIAIAIAASISSCQNAEKKYESVASTDGITLEPQQAADSATTEKIVKTADMRFRVKDVQSTKEKLSIAVKHQGGTVTEFAITSVVNQTDKIKQTTDSLKEITAYRTEGYLVAKIPSENLDDFTNAMAQIAVFIDNQSMRLDDQSIAYLANKLKAENRVEAVKRINGLATKKSPNVETSLLIKDDFIDRKIENLKIDDRVKYSTITLNFYQDNTIKTMLIANDNIYDYKPNFASRLWMGITNGWIIFKEIVLTLANLWVFIVLAGITIFMFKRFKFQKL
ncbi:DUF4349 domain-containing protein [Pedobacter sandarakinus]|uniref:DUF4349 domain-containing protein n=1 Tax=Pedobacter sandarakinus TaxID=353156 RepID=UPI00224666FF|nr:DUF4349 domain-containing protein [Pedobacter sandarakinus]MCX2576033.1 DUF4349 domain-containing protein [Pedobacter sandarakinus]